MSAPTTSSRRLLRATATGLTLAFGTFAVLDASMIGARAGQAGPNAPIRLPALQSASPTPTSHRASAVFAGGCFWGVQSVFQHVQGVLATRAGYDGGTADTAQYETVSSGSTGHAESVEVVYDPAKVSYATLMRVFFSVALDPTQHDAQFPDDGTQYRSVLFTRDTAQAEEARAYVAQLDAAHVFSRPIATEIAPDRGFYPAEAEHQNFAARYPDNSYISAYDEPRIEALRSIYPALYRQQPVLAPGGGG